MKNNLRNAVVISTNEEIQVYRRTAGGWVDFNDCKTVYQEDELRFKS